MRPYLFAIPFLFMASTAVAEPASKREEIRIPPELTDPKLVDRLMGRNPEHRFHFIQTRAAELDEEEIDA